MHNDTTYYRIENTATEEDFQNLMEEKTSKDNEELHGFGVSNVRRAVERMSGRMECRFQEGKVIMEIFA
jgi:sensor histidine kinase regulating citrate/malate metabolism